MFHTLVKVTPLCPNFICLYILSLKKKYENLQAKSTQKKVYISIKYCTKSIKLYLLYLRLYMQFFFIQLSLHLNYLLKILSIDRDQK